MCGQFTSKLIKKFQDKKVLKIRNLIIVEGKDIDETAVIRLLKERGTVAVEIEVTDSYIRRGVNNNFC